VSSADSRIRWITASGSSPRARVARLRVGPSGSEGFGWLGIVRSRCRLVAKCLGAKEVFLQSRNHERVEGSAFLAPLAR